MSRAWVCPYCNSHCVIDDRNISCGNMVILGNNKITQGLASLELVLKTKAVVCPNVNCKEITIEANLCQKTQPVQQLKHITTLKTLKSWDLLPESHAKVFPKYIPEPILKDYQEACAIVKLSPKASATLSRRCLQTIIRDFWKVKGSNLRDEIDAIQDKVSPEIFKAIHGVRKIGNIGAHMEKDINLILDIEPDEAIKLIKLIEYLLQEWHISKHESDQRLKEINDIADDKMEIKAKGKKSE